MFQNTEKDNNAQPSRTLKKKVKEKLSLTGGSPSFTLP
jgi:hypothetical protein